MKKIIITDVEKVFNQVKKSIYYCSFFWLFVHPASTPLGQYKEESRPLWSILCLLELYIFTVTYISAVHSTHTLALLNTYTNHAFIFG